VDQLYFESGYIVDGYYTIVREAAADLNVTATFTADGIIAVTTGYFLDDYIAVGYFVIGGVVQEAEAVFSVTVTQAVTGERIQQAAATVAVSVTKSTTVTRIIESTAAFTAAFAPTLTAEGIKNSTAVLDSVSTLTVDAVANKAANILLEHIANLNAQAAKTAVVDSTMATTISISSAPTKSLVSSATLASTVTFTCVAFNVTFFDAQLLVQSSIFTSRYLGTGRPRIIVGGSGLDFTTTSKYGSHALYNISSSANGEIALQSVDTIPKANQTWVMEAYLKFVSTTSGVIYLYRTANAFLRISKNTDRTLTIRLIKGAATLNITTSASVSSSAFTHVAIVYVNARFSVFLNGTRSATLNLNDYVATSDPWAGSTQILTPSLILYGTNDAIDEWSMHVDTNLGYDPNSTTITVPTEARINDPATTQFLLHFNNNFADDIAVTQSASAALSASATFTVQANVSTKQGAASLTSSASVTTDADGFRSATATLSSAFTVSATIGTIEDAISLEVSAVTLTADNVRVRYFESVENSAFTPSITVIATKVGETTLSSAFTISVNAISFSNVPATLSSQFTFSAAVDGITRLAGAALSSQASLTTNSGKLKETAVSLSGAMSFAVTAIAFEGTSLIAPMTATITVTATKTARITKTLSNSFSLSAVVRENTQAPAANPVTTVFPERVDVTVAYTYTYVKSATTRRSFNFTSNEVPGNLIAQSSFPNGSFSIRTATATVSMKVYEYGQSGSQDWYDIYVYTYDLGEVDTINIGSAAEGNGSGTIRFIFDAATTGLLTASIDEGPITLPAPSKTFSSRIYYPNLQPFATANTNGRFGWPPILFPTISNITSAGGNTNLALSSVSISNQSYNLYYGPQVYGQADLIDINFATLNVLPFLTQFGVATVQVQTAVTADVSRIRQGSVSMVSTASTVINAGKNVDIVSNLVTQSTFAVNAVKVATVVSDLVVSSVQSTINDRLRTSAVALTTAATASTTAQKITDITVNAQSTVTQTVIAFRIKQGESAISAFNSQLTAAFKNATGTVLLETQSQMQITAEKNAVGVIAVAAQFTQSTDTADAKIVRASAAVSAQSTQSTQGDRIQPAGSAMTSAFTQTASTTNSKITRVNADFSVTVTQSAQGQRLRDGIALQASLGTLSCAIDRLRQGSAGFVDSFDLLASPQYIIRITATFSAFNSILTVGEVINLDPYLTLMIKSETRGLLILKETRDITIESETRVNII